MKNEVFENYKNIHEGKRVFLVGNGPSLADTDLDLLENEISIAMNRVSMIYPRYKKWKPTYYLFSSTNVKDSRWGEEWTGSVRSAIEEESTTAFVAKMFKEQIDPEDNFPCVKWFESLSEFRPHADGTINEKSFSLDIIDRIDKTGTTMNLALQLAYHMGFKEIIFIGADLGWKKDMGSQTDPNHFDKSYRAHIPNPFKANHQMRNVHKMALKVFNKHKPDVRMYNASIRTVLDVYPIVSYDDLLNKGIINFRDEDQKIASHYWNQLKDKSAFEKSLIKLLALPKRVVNKARRVLTGSNI